MTFQPEPYRTNDVVMIFKSPDGQGEVWRDDAGNYGTYCAGHRLCVDMAKQIESLTAQRDAADSELARCQEKLAEIHQSWGMRNEC